MAKNEQRRQAKLSRLRTKKKRRDEEQRKSRAEAEQRRVERHRSAYGTTAYCWPIRYRKLFFEERPDLREGLNFAGMDLHMRWYESQEDREEDSNGEVVTALRIESCVEEEAAPNSVPNPNEIHLKCRGTLSEQIGRSSLYGQWYRMQFGAETLPETGDEYRDIPVEFTLQLIRFRSGQAKNRSRYLRSIDSLPVVPKAWNVNHIIFPESFADSGNALDIDRLYELLFMLKIWTPICSKPDFRPEKPASLLREELLSVEARERDAAVALEVLSRESKRLLGIALRPCSELSELEAKEAETKARYDARNAEFLELETKARSGASDDANASAALKRARKELGIARDNWLSVKTKADTLRASFEAEQLQRTNAFTEQMVHEFEAANDFTRPFLHRERLLAHLSLLES